MTDLQDRTHTTSPTTTRPRRGEMGPAPPAATPPTTPHAPWPRNAKVVVAILAVATLLAALGTFLAMRSNDEPTAADQQELIDTLTADQERLTADLETASARACRPHDAA